MSRGIRPLVRRAAVASELVGLRADLARIAELEVAVAENTRLATRLEDVVVDLEERLVPLLRQSLELAEPAEPVGTAEVSGAADAGERP